MENDLVEAAIPRVSEGEKEKIKLTAGYFNGIAIGLALVGGLTIPSSIALNATTEYAQAGAIGLSLFSIGLSPYIHVAARRWLARLDK